MGDPSERSEVLGRHARAHVTADRLSRGAGPPVASACSSFDFHVGRGQAALRLAPICTDAARCMAVLAKTVGSSR